MATAEAAFAARLAELRPRLDHPPGVMLGILRLPILDSILDELEAHVASAADPARPIADAGLVMELERMVELLSGEFLGAAPETQGRRARFVELLRRAGGGPLPVLAFDDRDAFGAELRAMVSTDAPLAMALGRLHPLVLRATSVAPTAKWLADARALVRGEDATTERSAAAIRRVLAALVRAEIVSRPDLLVGGVRLANQRIARGLLWLAVAAIEAPAELLGTVGLRMGTSGRSDAVVRDTALANTCAALLGSSDDPAAAAALASMRVRITNRNVLKQVDRALEVVAERAGLPVATVVELALPTFGLDAYRRVTIAAGASAATVEVIDDGTVRVRWRLADGRSVPVVPPDVAASDPAAVAEVAARIEAIEAVIAEERRRMEDRLASGRAWPEPAWRSRFHDHPIGGLFGRRLVWVVTPLEGRGRAALPDGDGWRGVAGQHVAPGGDPGGESTVGLWHPADAGVNEIAAWRAVLAAEAVEQPIRQVDREVFAPLERDRDLAADRRFAGRIVDHSRLRAILRERGWAAPFVGSWDQGDEATAWRAFDDGLRAELRYQAVERLATGERHDRVRLVAVRFVDAEAAPAAVTAPDARPLPLREVPARVFSEAIRDVSLVVAVAEPSPGG